jgi:hypothetical protein
VMSHVDMPHWETRFLGADVRLELLKTSRLDKAETNMVNVCPKS